MKQALHLGIDPGKSGGICGLINHSIGIVLNTLNNWKDLDTINHVLHMCTDYGKCHATIENVHAFPTDGRSSAFKFGQNLGQWEGLLTAHGIPFTKVVPHKWMSFYGEMPKDKKERKNKLKELAQKLLDDNGLPYRATLKNSDAILIANFSLQGGLDG